MDKADNIIPFNEKWWQEVHFKTEKLQIILERNEEEDLILSARRVLADIEDTWEINHGAVELRDKFHLLHFYLKCLCCLPYAKR